MEYFVVVNEYAKNGNAKQIWQTIHSELVTQGVKFTYKKVNENAVEVAKNFTLDLAERKKSKIVVLVVGGNGTLVDVLNGIKQAQRFDLPIGLVPAGIENGFAKVIGLSLNPVVALKQVINTTDKIYYTIGTYQETLRNTQGYFLNNFGIGMDAFITSIYNRKKKRKFFRRGFLPFLTSSISAYYNQEPFSATVRVSDSYRFFKHVYIMNVANHPYFEGDVSLSPQANIKDKKLDLIVTENMNFIRFFMLIVSLYFHKQLNLKSFHRFKDDQIHLTIKSLEFLQIDGEEHGSQYFDIFFKTTSYPFWFNLSSVPFKERRKK